MSHTNTIQAIRIYLKTVETETPSLGIFTSGGTSEIRISAQTLSGVALTWAHGIIAKGGIGPRGEGSDYSQGGNIPDYDGISFETVNTTQWIKLLEDMGVNLSGLTCELWEFEGTEADSDSESGAVKFTGVVEDIKGDESVTSIPVKCARYKRNVSICKTVNIIDFPNAGSNVVGKLIPASFGNFIPPDTTKINNLAKFIGLDIDVNYNKYTHAYFTNAATHPEWSIFPITDIGLIGTNQLVFKFAVQDMADIPGGPTLYPENMYVEFVSGTGSGQIKRVARIETTVDYAKIQFYISEVLTTNVNVSPTSQRAWVRFFDCEIESIADFWKCKDFLTIAGVSTPAPQLFSYDNGFNRIADYAYDATYNANKNRFKIVPSHTEQNISTINSFCIIPINNLSLESESTLSKWQSASRTDYSNFNKKENGIYYRTGYDIPDISGYAGLVNPANAYDRVSTSKADFTFQLNIVVPTSDAARYYKVLKFIPPILPDYIAENDQIKIYIGLKLKTSCVPSVGIFSISKDCIDLSKSAFHIVCKLLDGVGYLGDIWTRDADVFMLDKVIDDVSNVNIDDMPDFYFTDSPSSYNANFYKASSAPYSDLYGYTLFELGYDIKSYKAITEIGLFFGRVFGSPIASYYTDTLELYEAAIIIGVNGINVSNNVFPPFSGRVFNDTWGSRKTATALIQKPIDLFEHFCRLQDWSETGETSIPWGKAYATSAKIKTGVGVEGSFDHANLNTLTDQTPAFQVEDEGASYTDELKKLICRIYDVCNYTDTDGTECIETMALTNPADTVFFGDLAGDVGEIVEPKIENIFCEPVVNYQMNYGSGEYDKSLRIYNIQNYVKGSNWTACSSGFASLADAESALDIYYALYLKFRSTEKCPSSFSDTKIITTYADALSYIIRKGNAMGRKRQPSVSVFYDKGKNYHLAKHVYWNHPHQTGGEYIECMIEKISFDPDGNRVNMALLLLEDIPAL